ncbi:hypothetical protein KI387_025259, partial [Taxus chinensis]
SHWSESSGWEREKFLSMIEKEDLKENIKKSKFISLSIDEVTLVDNTAWVCIHVYTLENHIRTPHLLSVMKMVEKCNAENLHKIVVSHLKDITGMIDYEIATKLVCVGVVGASLMQGYRTWLCVQLQTTMAPYMLPIHCMAHRMNLAYKMVSNHENVVKLEDLIRELHAYMARRPKQFLEFQKFAIGITNGKKILKDVETRLISLYEPACRVREENPSL